MEYLIEFNGYDWLLLEKVKNAYNYVRNNKERFCSPGEAMSNIPKTAGMDKSVHFHIKIETDHN